MQVDPASANRRIVASSSRSNATKLTHLGLNPSKIDSCRTDLASSGRAIESRCRATRSRRRAIASRRRVTASRRRAIKARWRAIASRRRAVASPWRAIASRRRAMASPLPATPSMFPAMVSLLPSTASRCRVTAPRHGRTTAWEYDGTALAGSVLSVSSCKKLRVQGPSWSPRLSRTENRDGSSRC